MQLNSINYFVTIAQEKSISKAADKLFVSQPALSLYMKKIESELNTPLFVHGNRNFELTQAGEIFFQEGQVILQLYEQMMRRITSLANSNQEIVHFGISPFYSKYYLPKIIPHVLERYPWLQFNIIEEHSVYLEEKLAAGELDFCALPLYPKNPLLDYEVIHQEEIFLAVPRNHPVNALITPSSGISYIDLRLVRNEPFVSLKSIQKFSEMSHQLCEEAGFTPRTICETLNWDTVDTLVGTGLGVGFVPEVLVKAPTTENSPNYYRISAKAFRPYAIVTQKNSTISHPAMLIIDYFRKAFQVG